MKPMKAFVTDGDQRAALTIARSLGRRGICVIVGEERPRSLASSSRYCSRHVTYPSPYRHPEAFEQFMLDLVVRERVDVVLPVTDVTTHAIARHQDTLRRHSALATPPFEAFDLVADKGALLRRAARCGIAVPRTLVVDGIAGLKDLVEHVSYPAVIKPVRSRLRTDRGWRAASVHYARSESDLWSLYQQTDYLTSYPSLIQERISGPGIGTFVLFDHGRLLAASAHRRLREKPPSGGVSVLRESAPVDPIVRDHAIRLLGPLGWHGVAMLEYKQDRRSGTPYLMEVNGRFWGSLQRAVDAGVDFPYLAWQLALGHRPEIAPTYRVGVKSRWLLGDLDHLLTRLGKRDRDLQLPDAAPSKVRTLIDFFKFAAPDLHYEVIDREDLRPFLYECRQWVRALSRTPGS